MKPRSQLVDALTAPEEASPADFDFRQGRLDLLNRVLEVTRADNPFYACKWRQGGVTSEPLASVDEISTLPFTTRHELLADQTATPPLGTNFNCALSELKRFHRSSGTTRAPILWADSWQSWQWVMECSQRLWKLADARPSDRVLFLMPFGVSSGPWIIYEGACRLGCACLPAGSADAGEQLQWLTTFQPTVLVGKPSALQLLSVAAKAGGVPLHGLAVQKLILCGAHDRSLRVSLEQSWAAGCFNRYGLTEAGSVAAECPEHPDGLHLLDDAFIAESIDPDTGKPVAEGDPGELVLTTLGRLAQPIIRYRTGDRVRLLRKHECACGRRGSILLGNIRRMSC